MMLPVFQPSPLFSFMYHPEFEFAHGPILLGPDSSSSLYSCGLSNLGSLGDEGDRVENITSRFSCSHLGMMNTCTRPFFTIGPLSQVPSTVTQIQVNKHGSTLDSQLDFYHSLAPSLPCSSLLP